MENLDFSVILDPNRSQEYQMLINKCHRVERSVFLDEENDFVRNTNYNEELLQKYGEQVRQSFPECQKEI